MALARQRAVLAIEPIFSRGVARSRLADVSLPTVSTIATPVLRVATPVVQAFASLLAVAAITSKRAELVALKQ